jgi:hypothetical protein
LDFNEQMLTNLPHRDADRYIPHRHPFRHTHPDALRSPAHPDSSYSHHVKTILFPQPHRLISASQQPSQTATLPLQDSCLSLAS